MDAHSVEVGAKVYTTTTVEDDAKLSKLLFEDHQSLPHVCSHTDRLSCGQEKTYYEKSIISLHPPPPHF